MSRHETFAAIWNEEQGVVARIVARTGETERNVYKKRKKAEQALGIVLPAYTDRTNRRKVVLPKIGARVVLNDFVGTILVFSDAHWWPGEDRSPAFLALIELCKELRPKIVVFNGDMFDGARVSRFPTGWAKLPTVKDELQIVHERLSEIIEACPEDCVFIWPMGNHDTRMANRLAERAPEFEGVEGLDLKDHFDDLPITFCWSVYINNELFIKHRYRGGEHAAWNNTIRAGCTICTGHDHTMKVSPFIDMDGIRWGVTCGSLSEHGPHVSKFAYQEDNPSQHNQGFAVFTIAEDGTLLPPELCQHLNGKMYFRGEEVNAYRKARARQAA